MLSIAVTLITITITTAVAVLVGFGIAWIIGGRARRELVSVQQALASSNQARSEAEQNLAKRMQENQELERNLAQARLDSQKLELRITELERRVHDGGAWEAKYEKLLKEHRLCATKISDLEKTKVELNFCKQQLEAARKRSEPAG